METRSVTAPGSFTPTPALEARASRAPQQEEVKAQPARQDAPAPLTEDSVKDAATVANKALANLNTGVRLRVDKESDQIVAQFVDANDKVIKQIPPEDMLRIAANMRKLEGLLFNKEA